MYPLRVLRFRLRALFRGSALDRETEEEMRFHLELAASEYEAAGLAPEEARRRAALDFGGLDRQREKARDARGVGWITDLLRDVRHGLRSLRRSPLFAAVAIISLGLGVGANTAIFSLVNAILLKSLPVPNPQELRVLEWTGQSTRLNFTGSFRQNAGERLPVADAVSHSVFDAIRQTSADHAEVFGFYRLGEITAAVDGAASVASGLMVSDNFFEGLGVSASTGRVFTSLDPKQETAQAVIVADHWWRQRFGGDPRALGRTVVLNGSPFVVIGILPPGLQGLYPGDAVDFYVSMAAQPTLASAWSRSDETHWWIAMMARLGPGASEDRFRAAAAATFASAAAPLVDEAGLRIYDGSAGLKLRRDQYRRPLLILLGIVGVVILVACANLAGLSLARGVAREHEYAVRCALGAGRLRLLRHSLTENLLLGICGGAVAIPLALVGKAVLAELLLPPGERLRYDAQLDAGVLAFTLGLALLAGTLSGAFSAARLSAVDPRSGMRPRGAGAAPRLRMVRLLVVGQMALSVVLLVGAGLYGRTLLNLVRIDPGFEAEDLLLFRLNPAAAGYEEHSLTSFYDRVQESIDGVPGVLGVTMSKHLLLAGMMTGGSFFSLPGRAAGNEEPPSAHRHTVDESYFETMGIPMVLGRGFQRTDAEGAPKVVVVNETFAQKYFAGSSPLGQPLRVNDSDWTIVGVSRDAKYTDLKGDVPPTVYFSFRQSSMDAAFFAVRTGVPPLSLVDEVRAAVAAVDPGVPLAHVETQRGLRDHQIAQERLFAYLCGALAALAVLLCCIGIYGQMAYTVTRRSGEIGVRVALGATRRQIIAPIVREGLQMAVLALLAGVPVALGLARVVQSQLYGVAPVDSISVATGGAVLTVVTLLAVWLPARRAARVDPAVALREA